MSQVQPPRKRLRRSSKVALGFLIALVGASVVIVASVFAFGGWNATGAPPISQAATASANATSIAAAQTALANDLTQTAMTPDTQPTPVTPVVVSYGVGSSQTSGPWSITINSIKPTVSDNQFEVPKPGNQFVLINFTAHNNDVAPHDMNPFYFALRDDSGTSYDFTGLTVAVNPDGTVVAGQQLRGDLSYELPLSLRTVTLQFDPPEDYDHSQIVQWTLSV